MTPRAPLLLVLCLPLRLAAQSVATGDSALARGDTTGAIAAYEAAVAKNLQDAEAHYRAGMLRMSRFSYQTNLSEDRRKAEEHFEYASRFEGDSAKYWLAFAKSLRSESSITVRLQVPHYISKALEAAHKFGSDQTSEVEYQAARIYWERYEPLAHQWVFLANTITEINQDELIASWQYAENFVDQRIRPIPPNIDPGAADRLEAEQHLRAALAANPKNLAAAGLLAVLMGETERWPEAVDLTRRLVRAAPDSGQAWALWGMALTRARRWAEAQRTFDSALVHMTLKQLAPYVNLDRLLSQDGRRMYDTLVGPARVALDTLYWRVAQPLYLTDRNEPRTEFYARMAYVTYRWGDPLRGYEGYDSDRGSVYLRYGPPDVWASLGNERGADMGFAILWLYRPTKLRYLFSVVPSYAHTVFSGEFREFHRVVSNARPVRYDNVPAVAELDTVDVQVVQFRPDTAAARRTEVALFSFMPVGRMARTAAKLQMDLQAAAIVKDEHMRDVVKERQDARIQGGDSVQIERRTWRLSLAPSHYLMHVEARLPVLERAARYAASLDVRSFAGDTLMMSDLLLAGRVTPRDSAYAKWTDFFVEPSAGRFGPRDPVSLLWEVYNLKPDSSGVARYRVDVKVTVKEIERHGFKATVFGMVGDALGLSARGDDAVSLSYNRQVNARLGGRQVEYLTLQLENAPNATYDVAVAITDLVANHIVISSPKRLIVTPTELKPAGQQD